jgi:p70 ribosomal S6 kinase
MMVTTMTPTVEVQGVKKATMMISDGGDSAPASGHYAEEFDFSDVFGPVPAAHLSLQLPQLTEDGNCSTNWYPENRGDPIVVYSRSHSLVGPFPILTRQRSKLIWDEIGHVPFTEESEHTSSSSKDVVEAEVNNILSAVSGLELSDSGSELEVETPKTDVAADESPHIVGVERLGPQDFELLRVVGQGAFGRVFQVQKKGTTEIYAMKVMRKDKIMERNHGDYMKAERDILTKVVHPFIVQLQYSFQVLPFFWLHTFLDLCISSHQF